MVLARVSDYGFAAADQKRHLSQKAHDAHVLKSVVFCLASGFPLGSHCLGVGVWVG
jgi:hypothetical protein